MSWNLHVGQKVVCVDASGWAIGPLHPELPEEGNIYTIALITESNGHVGICLKEIETLLMGSVKGLFQASKFRPLVQRQTDISLFTAMLNPSKQKVRA